LNILCTNDDGYGAIGLEHLIKACSTLGTVWVVAPDQQKSECSHQLNTQIDLCPVAKNDRHWALNGSPADCTRLALTTLIPEKIDLVCSGINSGGNLGVDIFYSGTVAAAREAHLLGIPALAFSMVLEKGIEPNWSMAENGVIDMIEKWIEKWIESGKKNELWNVNFPAEAQGSELKILDCPLEVAPLSVQFKSTGENSHRYSGRYHDRQRSKGSDVDSCFSGYGTRTMLKLFP
jgi:5'-nucleotidase